jgi:hypothetical protein
VWCRPGGALIVPDQPLDLAVSFIRIESENTETGLQGEMHIGSESCPVTSRISITFFGWVQGAHVCGAVPVMLDGGS